MLNIEEKLTWPTYEESLIIDEKIPFVIQINGKKKSIFQSTKGIREEILVKSIKNDEFL